MCSGSSKRQLACAAIFGSSPADLFGPHSSGLSSGTPRVTRRGLPGHFAVCAVVRHEHVGDRALLRRGCGRGVMRALASIVAYGFQPVRLALNCCSCQMSRPLDFLQSSFWRKFGPA